MIAAVGSVLLTPWNLYSSPEVIHYTLDTLGAFIGPLYGVLIADYYLVKKQRVIVDDLYTLRPDGTYHYRQGLQPGCDRRDRGRRRGWAMIVVFFGSSRTPPRSSWFIGAFISFGIHYALSRRTAAASTPAAPAA